MPQLPSALAGQSWTAAPDIAGHRISQTTKSHMTYYLRVPVNATLLDPFGDRCGTLHLLPGHPLEALDAEGGFWRTRDGQAVEISPSYVSDRPL